MKRMSLRQSTKDRKPGHTQAQLGMRVPKTQAELRAEKEDKRRLEEEQLQLEEESLAQAEANVKAMALLEDELLAEDNAAEASFPRSRKDLIEEDSEEEGPGNKSTGDDATPRASKVLPKPSAGHGKRAASPPSSEDEDGYQTPTKAFKPKSVDSERVSVPSNKGGQHGNETLKRSFAVADLDNAQPSTKKKKKGSTQGTKTAAAPAAKQAKGKAKATEQAKKVQPKPRPKAKKAAIEPSPDGDEQDLFDLSHRAKKQKTSEPTPNLIEEVEPSANNSQPTKRPSRTNKTGRQVIDDGIEEIGSEHSEFAMDVDNGEGDEDSGDEGNEDSGDEGNEESDDNNNEDLDHNNDVSDEDSEMDTSSDSDKKVSGPKKTASRAKTGSGKNKKPKSKAKKPTRNEARDSMRDAIAAGRQKPGANNAQLTKPASKSANKLNTGLTEDWHDKITRHDTRKTPSLPNDSRRDTASNITAASNATSSNITAPSTSAVKNKKSKPSHASAVGVVSTAQAVIKTQPAKKKKTAPLAKEDNEEDNEDNKEDKDDNFGARFGGLEEEEDDQAEREAARQSPVKGQKRVMNENVVAVRSPLKKKKISELNTDDLPPGARDNWRKVFITTYGQYIGTTSNPWVIRDAHSLNVMRECWKWSFGDTCIYHIKNIHDPVFILGDQRWREMRSAVGAAGLTALDSHFNSIMATTNAQRQKEAIYLLDEDKYIYGTVRISKNTGQLKRFKPFENPLIIKALAAFLKWTTSKSYAYENDPFPPLVGKSPVGALGLAAAAVKRALEYWRDIPANDGPAAKPFTKRKGKPIKTEDEDDNGTLPADDPSTENSSQDQLASKNKKKESAYKIGEFNNDKWGPATNKWIKEALRKGFDSLAVIQPILEKAEAECGSHGSSGAPSQQNAGSSISAGYVLADDSDSGEE